MTDYYALAVELMEAVRPKERRCGLTEPQQYERVKDGTLRYLYEHDCVASPAQLTEYFGFSQARLTKILSELESEGKVLRRHDPADRRRVIIHLTDTGLEYACAKQAALTEQLMYMLQQLGETDAVHYVRILKRIHIACGMERSDECATS